MAKKNVIERINNTLMKYDLEIARAEAEIALCNEKISMYSNSAKQTDLQKLTLAKVDLENYNVFISHLKAERDVLNSKIVSIAAKYEGKYAKIFTMRYIDKMTVEEISSELSLKDFQVWLIIKNFEKEMKD